MNIRPAEDRDAAAIAEIFNYWIESSVAIWLPEPVSVESRRDWLRQNTVFVAEDGRETVGFAGFGMWKDSPGYRYTVTDSIYVRQGCGGRGIASKLLAALIDAARSASYKNIVASIEAGNEASIALHEKFGFQQVGLLPGVGYKNGHTLDLALLQLSLS